MADTTIVFFGIRLEVDDGDLDDLESRSHPMQIAAARVGLESYWGNFAAPNERYFLFVGKLLGKLGIEDRTEIQVNTNDFTNTATDVAAKLSDAGISQPPLLHLAYQPDA